jgi:uncharacterized membrane protein YGL010W
MTARRERLVSSLSEYAAYHTHPGNKAVHVVAVPLLLWSLFVILSSVAGERAAFALWAAYTLLFVSLEPVAGVGAALCYFCLLAHAQSFAEQDLSGPSPVAVAGLVHAASWLVQVGLGHGVFERRKPALLDSLVPSLALAPLFVLLEVAFAVGYAPELARLVHAAAAVKRQRWQR